MSFCKCLQGRIKGINKKIFFLPIQPGKKNATLFEEI